MAIAYPRNRIRLQVDTKTGKVKDVLTGGTPTLWNKSALDVEFAIFWDGELIDITAFASIAVHIMSKTRKGTSATSETVALADMDPALVLADWTAGTAEHGKGTFTAAAMNIDVNAAGSGAQSDTFWLKVIGTEDPSGDPVMLGGMVITIQESGIDLDSNLPAQGANLVPGGSVYDGAGEFELDVTVDMIHDWLKGANDTSVENGTQTVTTSGRFTAQSGTVILHGTIGAAVTAIVRYPLYPTWDDLTANDANLIRTSNAAGVTTALRSPNGRYIRILGVDDNGQFTTTFIDTQNIEPA